MRNNPTTFYSPAFIKSEYIHIVFKNVISPFTFAIMVVKRFSTELLNLGTWGFS